MTKKQEVAETTQNTALAALQEQLRDQALKQQEVAEEVGGNNIKASHTGFEVPGIGDVEAPLNVVILGFVSRKTYYDKPYNPNEVHPPACAAIGAGTFDSLVPQEDAPDKQHDACKGCPMNEFGTSNTGKGKKCTDQKYIAFMLPDAAPDDPIYTANISPSGLKAFNSYISRLTKRYQVPTYAFISELNVAPAGASVTINVKEVEPLPDVETMNKFMARQSEAMDMLLSPIKFDLG